MTGHEPHCRRRICERDRITTMEAQERIKRFDALMDQVRELREARAREIYRRDHAEWCGWYHFACQTSLLKNKDQL